MATHVTRLVTRGVMLHYYRHTTPVPQNITGYPGDLQDFESSYIHSHLVYEKIKRFYFLIEFSFNVNWVHCLMSYGTVYMPCGEHCWNVAFSSA